MSSTPQARPLASAAPAISSDLPNAGELFGFRRHVLGRVLRHSKYREDASTRQRQESLVSQEKMVEMALESKNEELHRLREEREAMLAQAAHTMPLEPTPVLTLPPTPAPYPEPHRGPNPARSKTRCNFSRSPPRQPTEVTPAPPPPLCPWRPPNRARALQPR